MAHVLRSETAHGLGSSVLPIQP